MIWIYLAATIFGCAFLVPMVLGGLDSEVGDGFGGDLGEADLGGVDFDVDTDIDAGSGLSDVGSDVELAGVEGEMPHDGAWLGDALGSVFSSIVSFRTIVFFSAFFGAAGLVFGAVGYSVPVTVGTAVLIGTIAALANSVLFGLIKNSQPNSQISDRTLEGRPATVVLPMQGSRRGRIRIDLSGQPQYIVARPMEGVEQQFDVGASVVVVKIENGTAHVASLAELDSGEES